MPGFWSLSKRNTELFKGKEDKDLNKNKVMVDNNVLLIRIRDRRLDKLTPKDIFYKGLYGRKNYKSYLKKNNKNDRGDNLIFILGLPRSGTTLTHQILAAHSKVYGAGELTLLSQLIQKVFGPSHVNTVIPL